MKPFIKLGGMAALQLAASGAQVGAGRGRHRARAARRISACCLVAGPQAFHIAVRRGQQARGGNGDGDVVAEEFANGYTPLSTLDTTVQGGEERLKESLRLLDSGVMVDVSPNRLTPATFPNN